MIQGVIGANTAGGARNPFAALPTMRAQRRRARRGTVSAPPPKPAMPPAAAPAPTMGVAPGTNPFGAQVSAAARRRLGR